MASNLVPVVPKLRGSENYSDWVFALENYLILEGLSNCMDESETDPEKIAKVKTKVVLTLDPALFIHVREAKSAKEIHDIFKNLYDDSAFASRISLLCSLISTRLENCNSMAHYVNQVIQMGQKLRGTGFDINANSIKTKLFDMADDEASSGSAFAGKINWRNDKCNGNAAGVNRQQRVTNRVHGNTGVNINQYRRYGNVYSISDSHDNRVTKIRCYSCKQTGHYQNNCRKNVPYFFVARLRKPTGMSIRAPVII